MAEARRACSPDQGLDRTDLGDARSSLPMLVAHALSTLSMATAGGADEV